VTIDTQIVDHFPTDGMKPPVNRPNITVTVSVTQPLADADNIFSPAFYPLFLFPIIARTAIAVIQPAV